MRRAALVTVAAVMAVGLGGAPAFAGIDIRHADTTHFPTVEIVVSSDDGRVPTPEEVTVEENGATVATTSVTALGTTSGHVDAVLAIDVSNSMSGEKLATALAAAKVFVQKVPDWIDVGVVAFADSANVVSPISSDRAAVTSSVDSMGSATSSGTALYDAVVQASELFTTSGQHNLIIVTDGKNTSEGTGLADAIAAAHQAHMTVYPVGIAGPQTDQTTLAALADATGGSTESISPDALDAVYTNLARQLGAQYVVRYISRIPRGVTAEVTVSTANGKDSVRVLTPPYLPTGGSSGGLAAWLYTSNIGLLLAVLLTFVAGLSFMGLITATRSSAQRQEALRRRIAAQTAPSRPDVHGGTGVIPQQVSEAVEWGARATGVAGPTATLLERAAWRITVGEFYAGTLGAAFLTVIVLAIVLRSPIPAVIAGVAVGVIPYIVLSRAARKRATAMQEQLSDVLMILASALRAGHSFVQALDTATKEVADPAATEFGRSLAEMRLGRPVDDALTALVERVGSQDLEWAVTAISIQRRVGGNLAEVLETLGATIRERETLRRQMRVLSAEGRLSVTILTALPFLMGAYIYIVNREYMQSMTGTTLGLFVLVGAGLLIGVGYAWMRRIVRLDV